MRTMTRNEEAASWSRSSHLMGTRLPPSNDDSDDTFSGTPGTEIMTNPTTPVTGTV
jgi:hypothetical protein